MSTIRVTVDGESVECDVDYDGDDGTWYVQLPQDRVFVSGSGGSLELAMYSFCRALRAYREEA